MKKILFLIVGAIFLASCSTTYVVNDDVYSVKKPVVYKKVNPDKIQVKKDSIVISDETGDNYSQDTINPKQSDYPDYLIMDDSYAGRLRVFHNAVVIVDDPWYYDYTWDYPYSYDSYWYDPWYGGGYYSISWYSPWYYSPYYWNNSYAWGYRDGYYDGYWDGSWNSTYWNDWGGNGYNGTYGHRNTIASSGYGNTREYNPNTYSRNPKNRVTTTSNGGRHPNSRTITTRNSKSPRSITVAQTQAVNRASRIYASNNRNTTYQYSSHSNYTRNANVNRRSTATTTTYNSRDNSSSRNTYSSPRGYNRNLNTTTTRSYSSPSRSSYSSPRSYNRSSSSSYNRSSSSSYGSSGGYSSSSSRSGGGGHHR